MKSRIVFLYFCFACQIVTAQDWYDDPGSYNGTVVLNDRSTKRGVFSYNQSNEYLLFEDGKQIKASEASYFQYYDHNEKYNRYFFSFISSDDKFRFYETLLKGKILLYRKSILVEKSYIDYKKSTTNLFFNKKIVEALLYFNNTDKLSRIEDFEAQILPLMKDQIRAVSGYIFSKQLNINSANDQLIIIDYYNQLFEKK